MAASIVKSVGPVYYPSFLLPRLGPWLCGSLAQQFLAGVVFAQLCLYLSRFGLSDSRATKALIAVVMLLSLLDDLKVWAIGLLTYVAHFGDLEAAVQVTWLLRSETIVVGSMVVPVQSFFFVRCLKNLSGWHRHAFISICVPLLIATWVGAVLVGVNLPKTLLTMPSVRKWVIIWAGVSISVDCIISGTLIIHLYQQTNSTSFSKTQSLLLRLIRTTLLSSCLVTLASFTGLVLFLSDPESNYFLVSVAVKGKLALVSFFYVLNSRHGLRKSRPTSFVFSMQQTQRVEEDTGSTSKSFSPTLDSDTSTTICQPLPIMTKGARDRVSFIDV